MGWVRLVIIISTIFFMGRAAWSADGEVQTQLNQLKLNQENSEKNKEGYEKNQKISADNVKAIDENLKALATQRAQIHENVKKADANVAIMDKQEGQINSLIKKETDQEESEKKQVAALEERINKLKENMAKRESNIMEYQGKMKTISTEKNQWMEQKKIAEDVEKTIDGKEKQANVDRAEWKKKANAYAAEVAKWKSEADTNRSTFKKYDKLNK